MIAGFKLEMLDRFDKEKSCFSACVFVTIQESKRIKLASGPAREGQQLEKGRKA